MKLLSYFNDFKISKNQYLWIIAVILLNFILKISTVDNSPLWYDEIISIKNAYQDFGHIKHTSEWDNNPPFYYYCLSVVIKIFGDTEFIVRFLSVLFSSIAAGYLFLISNKYFNTVVAISVSLLFLASNIVFYYSHEARAYSLTLMLSLISTWLYFELKNKQGISTWILLGVVNFLIVYTHYIAGLVLFFQTILMLFYFDKIQKKHYSYSLIITIILVFIRFTKKQFLLIFNFNSSENTFWLQKSEFEYLKEVLSSFLFGDRIYIILLGIAALVLVLLLIKKIPSQFYITYSFLLGVSSIFLLYLLGKFTPIFLDRYLLFSIPFLYLTIASIGMYIKNSIFSLSIFCLFFIYVFNKVNLMPNKNMDYRSTVNFIKKEKKNDDLIIIKTKDIMPIFGYYYEKDFLKNKKSELSENENIITCDSWNDVNKDVTKFERVIVIDSYEGYNPHEKDFVAKLSNLKNKYFVTNFFQGVKISVYQ